ncbi:ATP-binding cassette domain-containing protein [uncultured Anaerococcus sp.]|uniref:ABC transporter ATP-binding protein n=1 Tax=uncultured Anaerococcus sp. TaxID=293428 RepID=UPI002607D3F4|nr:ABC transporter ATP-binding protein [uncultured Anaerococcus sp.]
MKIELKGINRKYFGHEAIKDFNWTINLKEGLVHGLIGPNGAGKTTVLKILSGIFKFESGDILIDGIDSDYASWARENISFIAAGERGIRFTNTVFDNVIYFSELKGFDIENTKLLYEKYSDILNANDLRDVKVGSLSTGQKKKASLLCALCSNSRIIILDEPSDGLDISAKVDLENIIKDIASNSQTNFIISTHDIDFISPVANAYTFVNNGKNAYDYNGFMENKFIKDKFLELKESAKWGEL